MLLEILLGLVPLRSLPRPITFQTAVGQSVAGGLLLGLPPFGLLARSAKIDEVAHVKLGGNQMLLHRAPAARFGLELLCRTLTLEHGNSESSRNLQLPLGSVAIPPMHDNTRMLEKKNSAGAVTSSSVPREQNRCEIIWRCLK